MNIAQTANQIDNELGDRTRARVSQSRVAAMLFLGGKLRSVHITALKIELELLGVGMFELDSGALGLIRVRALEGAQHL